MAYKMSEGFLWGGSSSSFHLEGGTDESGEGKGVTRRLACPWT